MKVECRTRTQTEFDFWVRTLIELYKNRIVDPASIPTVPSDKFSHLGVKIRFEISVKTKMWHLDSSHKLPRRVNLEVVLLLKPVDFKPLSVFHFFPDDVKNEQNDKTTKIRVPVLLVGAQMRAEPTPGCRR